MYGTGTYFRSGADFDDFDGGTGGMTEQTRSSRRSTGRRKKLSTSSTGTKSKKASSSSSGNASNSVNSVQYDNYARGSGPDVYDTQDSSYGSLRVLPHIEHSRRHQNDDWEEAPFMSHPYGRLHEAPVSRGMVVAGHGGGHGKYGSGDPGRPMSRETGGGYRRSGRGEDPDRGWNNDHFFAPPI